MTEPIKKLPSAIDLAEYNYIKDKPKAEINLTDLMAITVLEEKYPELKS